MAHTLTEKQAAYIAGFLDADGSIITQIVSRKDYVLKYQIRVCVTFIQKMERKHFFLQLQEEIGKGTLRERNDGIVELALVGSNTVLPFLRQIQPYLRLKRKQANLTIQLIEQLPLTKNDPEKFLELCMIADRVASLNDSKNHLMTSKTVKDMFQDLGLIKITGESP